MALSGEPLLQVLVATALCGGVGGLGSFLWRRFSRAGTGCRERTAGAEIGLELALVALLLAAGGYEATRLHTLANPWWVPFGLDYNDFLGHLGNTAVEGTPYTGGYRYPLYPWLAEPLVRWLHVPPYLAGMRISLYAQALLPAAVYGLGRLLSPRPLAFAGGLALVHLPGLLDGLGHPSDYSLAVLLRVGVLAAGIWALRSGRAAAFLLLGSTTALLATATSKALVVLLVVLPLGLAALPWRRGRRLPWAAAGLLLPLVGAWGAMAASDLEPRPLEYNLYQVERHYAGQQGIRYSPEDYGWPADARPAEMGTWRVGSTAALVHLPETLRHLLRKPPGYPPLSARWPGIVAGLHNALGLDAEEDRRVEGAIHGNRRPGDPAGRSSLDLSPRDRGVAAGLLLGVLAAASRGRSPARRALAVLFTAVLVGGSFYGATGLPYAVRFFLPVLAVIPVLCIAGCALPFRLLLPRGRRGMDLPWWPVPVLVAGLVAGSDGPWGPERAEARVGRLEPLESHVAGFLDLQYRLEPEDVVVDLTDAALAFALFANRAQVVMGTYTDRGPPLHVPETTGANRRYLVLCRAVYPCRVQRWSWRVERWLRRSERFEEVSRGIWEDLEPGGGVVLLPDYQRR